MSVLTPKLAAFLDSQQVAVLATQPSGGRPRQSVVYYAREGERLLVSTEAQRFKARDVRATGWASLCVLGHAQPYPSATFSGPAEILTEGIGPATAAIVQLITGGAEAPEAQSDAALAEAGRVILAITIERVGPISYVEQ